MPFKTNFHSEKKGFSSNIDHFRSEFLRLPKDGGASARPKSGTRLVENWQNAKRDLGGRREKVRHRRKRRPERWPSNRPSIEEALFFGGGGGEALRKKKPSTTFGAEETVVGFGRRSRKKIRKRKLSALATEKEAKKRKASFSLRGRDPASASFLSLSLSSAARGFGAGALDADT